MHTFHGQPIRLRALRTLILALLISLMTAILISLPAPAAAAPGAAACPGLVR